MKIKQYKLIGAYNATERLADNEHLSVQILWNLYKLRKKLEPYHEFRGERENALRIKYLPFTNDDGQIRKDHLEEFWEDMRQLNELEVDFEDFEKFSINVNRDGVFTIRDIEALEEFINFRFECLPNE